MLSNLTLFSSIVMLKDMINKIKFFIQNIHYSLKTIFFLKDSVNCRNRIPDSASKLS